MIHSPEFGGMAVEPMVGEITALRTFRITDDGYLLPLTEAGGTEPWPVATSSAKCNRGKNHLAPDVECSCGFYAYGNRAWVENSNMYLWSHIALAAVHCSGRIVAGEKGLRAEKMRLVACYVNKHAPRHVLDRLAQNYPDVEFHDSKKSLLAAHPETPLDTYFEPPRQRAWSGGRILKAAVPPLVVAMMMFSIWVSFLGGGPLSVHNVFTVFLALVVWSLIFAEVIAQRTLGMSTANLVALRRYMREPWIVKSKRRRWLSFGWRLVVLSGILAVALGATAIPLADGGWPLALSCLGAAAVALLVWLELSEVLPPSKAFPLFPRTGAVLALRETVHPGQGKTPLPIERASWSEGITLSSGPYVSAMAKMDGYGVGMIHFDIVSDPADYPVTRDLSRNLASQMKVMATKLGLGNRWVAFIASDGTNLRVLNQNGAVSVPVPLAEIDAILPLPTRFWCPPEMRHAYVHRSAKGDFDAKRPPYQLPLRYREREGGKASFTDSRIEDSLRDARRISEQDAYRNFKRDQARLPEGFAPVATPLIGGHSGPAKTRDQEVQGIVTALGTLMDAPYEKLNAPSIAFAMGEFMDALHSLGLANEVVSYDASNAPIPADASMEMCAAHHLLFNSEINPAEGALAYVSRWPRHTMYGVYDADQKSGPKGYILTLHAAGMGGDGINRSDKPGHSAP